MKINKRSTELTIAGGEHEDNVLKGAIYAALAFFLLAVMSACAKLLSVNHNVIEIAFYRNLVALIPMLIYVGIANKWQLLHIENKPMLGLRVLVGVVGLIITFAAIGRLPISDASVIFMSSNLIIPVLAFFFLKEHIGIHRKFAIFIGFLGILLVAAPTGHVSAIGVFLALIAACIHATIHILLRYLKNEQAFTVTFYFILGGVVVPGLFMPWIALWPTQYDIMLFIAVGISGGFAQYCLTSAFKYAPATVAAPFSYTGLLWATALDMIIWKHVPGWHVYVGGAIIIGAKIYILHRENIRKHKNKGDVQ